MLKNSSSAQEKWGGVNDIVDKWLHERKELLVLYCTLSDTVEDAEEELSGPAIQRLCQIMVDYMSAGHFEVYGHLVKEGHTYSNEADLKSADESFKVIDSTTEIILDFNDKYQETDDLGTIMKDLSSLGEALEQRFEAEDNIIEVLHVANRNKVAS